MCMQNLTSKGIKVINIQPACVATPMTLDVPGMEFDPEKEIQPEDIARLCLLPFQLSKWANVQDLTATNMIPPMKG